MIPPHNELQPSERGHAILTGLRDVGFPGFGRRNSATVEVTFLLLPMKTCGDEKSRSDILMCRVKKKKKSDARSRVPDTAAITKKRASGHASCSFGTCTDT
jgi:hypothetical protein